ncbi:hypothetical protein ZEAMMB73_Zm00001d008509 [Zea mays]|uniref:Uncharacterized protein n=1 Tax=Zea mays TaxID=4577 RepID=A0A1D6FDA8_MAIZE|nr:hypothetical protein ZEAMMB73_Zm00001d008509 [Zea mays]
MPRGFLPTNDTLPKTLDALLSPRSRTHAVGKQGPIVLDLKSSAFDPKEKVCTKFPPEGSKCTLPTILVTSDGRITAPRTLRKLFKVDAADYMLSLCGNEALMELSSPGKNGSFFYLTNDDRYMIKTMKKSEVKMLLKMLPAYYNHVRAFENKMMKFGRLSILATTLLLIVDNFGRIAIAYLLAAVCEIWLKGDDDVDSGYGLLRRYRYQLFVGLVLSIAYSILLYGIYVPDWEYQIAGPGSSSTKKSFFECSIDYLENGPLPPDAPSWCQAPFDPEGLLSFVMAIVTCLIGLQFRHVIIHFEKHRGRIASWLVPSFSMLALAFVMDFVGMRMNKPLYTMSYTLAAGAAGLLFPGIYVLVGPS